MEISGHRSQVDGTVCPSISTGLRMVTVFLPDLMTKEGGRTIWPWPTVEFPLREMTAIPRRTQMVARLPFSLPFLSCRTAPEWAEVSYTQLKLCLEFYLLFWPERSSKDYTSSISGGISPPCCTLQNNSVSLGLAVSSCFFYGPMVLPVRRCLF